MIPSFRDLIESLYKKGELQKIKRPVDIRYVGTLVEESDTALLFENVAGYDMPVVSGLINSPRRMEIASGCDYSKIYNLLESGIEHPVAPVMVDSAPVREVAYQIGDEVDLFSLPIPLFAELDGGPMITPSLIIARDEESGLNAGFYRLMLREKNLTSIDIVTPNDLRRIVEKNTKEGKSTPVSINIGTNLALTLGTGYKAPPDVNELEVAGGMMGAPVGLAKCDSVDVPCIADAEIVMEAEILPTGWTKPEGRFGEFHRAMGALHWNPHVLIKAIYTRKNPIYWAFHMPWEVIWLAGPAQEGMLRRKLHEVNVKVTAINFTPGSSCFFHAISAIKAGVGDGKIAMLAALADDVKHVVVVDDDIDIFNPTEVDWAIATRVQADKDVVIISGVRAKPLDPSLDLVTGRMPTTAKMGIDATISRDLPRERFRPVRSAFADDINADEYLADTKGRVEAPEDIAIEELAEELLQQLEGGEPMYYAEIVKQHWSKGFKTVNKALALIHEKGHMWQDDLGRVCHRKSPHAAVPPTSKLTSRA